VPSKLSSRERHRRRVQRAHDRRHLYRPDELPAHAQIAAVEIEDPYSQAGRVVEGGHLEVTARLEQFQHRDGTLAKGAPGWTPPTRPLIQVVQSLKNDPLGHMRARKQIDNCAFLAGREYQRLYIVTRLGKIKSPSMNENVDGSGNGHEFVTDAQRAAVKRIARLDKFVFRYHGGEALLLVRDVLGECIALETAAHHRGARGERDVRWWGKLFRKSLNVIAAGLGFASHR
jgi:hypothetical protein